MPGDRTPHAAAAADAPRRGSERGAGDVPRRTSSDVGPTYRAARGREPHYAPERYATGRSATERYAPEREATTGGRAPPRGGPPAPTPRPERGPYRSSPIDRDGGGGGGGGGGAAEWGRMQVMQVTPATRAMASHIAEGARDGRTPAERERETSVASPVSQRDASPASARTSLLKRALPMVGLGAVALLGLVAVYGMVSRRRRKAREAEAKRKQQGAGAAASPASAPSPPERVLSPPLEAAGLQQQHRSSSIGTAAAGVAPPRMLKDSAAAMYAHANHPGRGAATRRSVRDTAPYSAEPGRGHDHRHGAGHEHGHGAGHEHGHGAGHDHGYDAGHRHKHGAAHGHGEPASWTPAHDEYADGIAAPATAPPGTYPTLLELVGMMDQRGAAAGPFGAQPPADGHPMAAAAAAHALDGPDTRPGSATDDLYGDGYAAPEDGYATQGP